MDGQEYKIRDMLILEDDRKKKIKKDNDEFIIKAPFPRDQKEIARRLALEYNGLPVNSFSLDDRYIFTRDISIDILVEEYPKWWKDADNCLDNDLKEWLYQEITNWAGEFQEKLKKNKFNKRGDAK